MVVIRGNETGRRAGLSVLAKRTDASIKRSLISSLRRQTVFDAPVGESIEGRQGVVTVTIAASQTIRYNGGHEREGDCYDNGVVVESLFAAQRNSATRFGEVETQLEPRSPSTLRYGTIVRESTRRSAPYRRNYLD